MTQLDIASKRSLIPLRLTVLVAFASLVPTYLLAAPTIVPTVQQIQEIAGEPLTIDESWVIAVNRSDDDELFNANYLCDSLAKEFGLSIEIVDVSSKRAKSAKRVVIGKPATSRQLEKLVLNKGIQQAYSFMPEEYLLDSSMQDGQPDIFVLAGKSAGVFYGIQTLLKHPNGAFQALFIQNHQLRIERMIVNDYPDKSIRGAFLPLSTDGGNSDIYEWIDVMARLKMNLIVMGQDTSELVDLEQLYAFARKRYMEPVPFLRGLSGGPFVEENPHIAEGIPVIDELFQFNEVAGQLVAEPVVPVDQSDLVVNRGFESQVDLFSDTWSFSGSSHWIWDTSVSHSGTASVKMHVTSDPLPELASERLDLKVTNYIPVNAGESYTLSFWAKTDGIGGKRVPIVRTIQLDANRNFTIGTFRGNSTIRLPRGSTDWRQYFQPIYVAEGTQFLSITSFTDKEGFGTVWLDDFELRRMNGALVNVLRSEATDIRISSQDGLTLYEEGADYRVIDGELEMRSLVNGTIYLLHTLNRPTQIELVATGRIDPSNPVSISYDFVVMPVTGQYEQPHYSVSDPWTYRQHVFPYLDDMIFSLQPNYVLYAGASEVTGINRDGRNDDVENYQIIAQDINTIHSHLKELNSTVKVFLWDDMISPWHNGSNLYHQSRSGGGKIGPTEPQDLSMPRVTDLIPRQDIILWAWWYREDDENRIANTPDYLERRSFEWIASPEDEIENILDWAAACKGRSNCLGMIDWANSTYDGIESMADYAWNNRNQ